MLLHRRLSSSLLAVALAASPVFGSPARAAVPSERPPLRADLTVDALALGTGGEHIKDRIEDRGAVSLREADIRPRREGKGAEIRVVLKRLTGKESGYLCMYSVRRRGKLVAGTKGETVCKFCTEAELYDQVDETVARLGAELRRRHLAQPTASDPPPRSPAPSEDQTDRGSADKTDEVPARTLGRLGKVGVGLTVGGVVAAGFGAGLAIVDSPPSGVDTRLAGIGVAATGGAIAVTGVILLIVDATRRSKRDQANAPSVQLGLDRRALSLSVSGRF